MICEKFKCDRDCRKPKGCENTCLFALDIYKCGICLNEASCKGSDLYNKIQEEKRYQLSKIRKGE